MAWLHERTLKPAKRPSLLKKLVATLTDHTMLASASKHDASFTIWNVAQGTVLVFRLTNVLNDNIHFLLLLALGVSCSELFLVLSLRFKYVWLLCLGTGTPLQRGLGDISLLKWSPTGDYFVSAKQ